MATKYICDACGSEADGATTFGATVVFPAWKSPDRELEPRPQDVYVKVTITVPSWEDQPDLCTICRIKAVQELVREELAHLEAMTAPAEPNVPAPAGLQ